MRAFITETAHCSYLIFHVFKFQRAYAGKYLEHFIYSVAKKCRKYPRPTFIPISVRDRSSNWTVPVLESLESHLHRSFTICSTVASLLGHVRIEERLIVVQYYLPLGKCLCTKQAQPKLRMRSRPFFTVILSADTSSARSGFQVSAIEASSHVSAHCKSERCGHLSSSAVSLYTLQKSTWFAHWIFA